jgi:hypothetical protein
MQILLSDIVMPHEASGIELVREARRLTSSYVRDVLKRQQAVDEVPIIDKPYRRADLALRLRSILDRA